MNDLSKKKQSSDSSAEKTYYNMNSFRGLKIDNRKQSNEIKINANNFQNLTSRIFETKLNQEKEKSRTISKNKIITEKTQANINNTNEKNRSILEISYNQKSSPKKLFAETSKKRENLIQNTNEIINTNPNYYMACLTDENEIRKSKNNVKLNRNKDSEKFMVRKFIKKFYFF